MKNVHVNPNARLLPSVDKILRTPLIAECITKHGRELATYAVRTAIDTFREMIEKNSIDKLDNDYITRYAKNIVMSIAESSLKPVINASGIVLHTNLGRAPLGDAVLDNIYQINKGYSNVEFDLEKADRGNRGDHIINILRYLTGAEDSVVVNNNAAAIILVLNTLAKGREVIISRGELVEIGGEFRIPDIMRAAGVKMVEVGTTNRTRISDYEDAISSDTALIVKAHKSNYSIIGFTEEVSIEELSLFAQKKQIPFLYDIGSGLLRRPSGMPLESEPDVKSSIASGVDLVCFSGDKLLGGPQAGIIAGKSCYIQKLSKAPLMRALRVGKLTLAALSGACRSYLDDKTLIENNPIFKFLERSETTRQDLAQRLLSAFKKYAIQAEIIESVGRCGGGTLPDLTIKSYAVSLSLDSGSVKKREAFCKGLFLELLKGKNPVLAVLREGKLLFDVFSLWENEIELIAECVDEKLKILSQIIHKNT